MERLVTCVKLKQELPGLPYPPFIRGALGARIYHQISQQAWKQWLGHATKVINEGRLNPSEPAAQEVLRQQLELFLFGPGVAPPAGWTPPTAV